MGCNGSKIKSSEAAVSFYRNNSDTLLLLITQINKYQFVNESTNSKRLTFKKIRNAYPTLLTKPYLSFFKSNISTLDIENFNDTTTRKFSFVLNNTLEEDGGIGYLFYDKSGARKNFENARISKTHVENNWYYLIVKNF